MSGGSSSMAAAEKLEAKLLLAIEGVQGRGRCVRKYTGFDLAEALRIVDSSAVPRDVFHVFRQEQFEHLLICPFGPGSDYECFILSYPRRIAMGWFLIVIAALLCVYTVTRKISLAVFGSSAGWPVVGKRPLQFHDAQPTVSAERRILSFTGSGSSTSSEKLQLYDG